MWMLGVQAELEFQLGGVRVHKSQGTRVRGTGDDIRVDPTKDLGLLGGGWGGLSAPSQVILDVHIPREVYKKLNQPS
eukprot:964168-Pyramimonas_sp.AAC.1